jgi:hypothetical protein
MKAKASIVTPPPVKPEPVVVLTLSISLQEAGCLRGLCRNIAGSTTESARRVTDEIDAALRDAGVKAADDAVEPNCTVVFRPYKECGF